MGIAHARHVLLALSLSGIALVAACAEAPPPVQPRQESQGAIYQQQAGYAQAPGQYPPPAPPGQPGAPAPTSSSPYGVPGLVEMAPTNVPDAVAQLDRAEQLLGFVLASPGVSRDASGQHAAPPPMASAAPGTPVPLADPCLIACVALASMKRSADHVCSMAGENDSTCGGARARVQRAEQRVIAACPACAATSKP